MSDGALTVLDGTHLRAVDLSLPDSDVILTGGHVLDLADSKASSSLFGLSLPQGLKSSALKRVNVQDDDVFRQAELDRHQALKLAGDYIAAIADELKDDPLVISILDGNTIRLFLEDEDDFAMLAENLFTDLDAEDVGKINKSAIRSALVHMGVEMGVPPASEFPPLSDILTKHEANGEEELGQAQFAELLQPILQELAEALAKKNVVLIQNIKIVNGSKLRKLLADEKQLNNVVEKILQGKKDDLGSAEVIRSYLEKNGLELGLPPSEGDEAVAILYDLVFAELKEDKSALKEGEDKFENLVKKILEKLAEQLEANPVFHDTEH
ncbi:hypothetical protein RchiOBHm_Chr3g0451171 [Rosa chinensis]|uniref:Uncharacterized protein n=1 Tax=Rosa chinensis TaxID=74649 RepID=A0A2P6R5Z0_ROSCH|nr:uncharacterized protein LOC112193889 [Rosa chinensis]PRQ41847.1 hypothetical protein RchiOBHm_Chr3g0451171 [Rosa chinensis]